MDLIECKNLCKNYGENMALKDVNLKIGKGKIVGLLGKNGAGKTTLIKLLNDLLKPTSGEILINGKNVGIESKKFISYLPDRFCFEETLKVAEIMNMVKEFFEDFDTEKARKLLKEMDLNEDMVIEKMSKGMKEKFQLLLCISRKAELYILDEPLGGVDPASRDYIIDLILKNVIEGSTVLISTHLIADIERMLDEVIFIDDGKIVIHSETDELREKENASIDEIFRRMFKC